MSICLILPSALLLVPYMTVEVHWPMMTTLCCRWSVLRKTGRCGVGKTRCLLRAQADKCKPLINGRCTNCHLIVLREVRYDTIRHGMRVEHGLKSWLWPLSLIKQTKQKNKKYVTNKQTPVLSSVQVNDVWKRWVLSLEKKTEEWWMVRAKTGTVKRWCAQDEMNQEDREQDEVDGTKKRADSTGKVM